LSDSLHGNANEAARGIERESGRACALSRARARACEREREREKENEQAKERKEAERTHARARALSLRGRVCVCERAKNILKPDYKVATISRLLKIIGLFCKRAL